MAQPAHSRRNWLLIEGALNNVSFFSEMLIESPPKSNQLFTKNSCIDMPFGVRKHCFSFEISCLQIQGQTDAGNLYIAQPLACDNKLTYLLMQVHNARDLI